MDNNGMLNRNTQNNNRMLTVNTEQNNRVVNVGGQGYVILAPVPNTVTVNSANNNNIDIANAPIILLNQVVVPPSIILNAPGNTSQQEAPNPGNANLPPSNRNLQNASDPDQRSAELLSYLSTTNIQMNNISGTNSTRPVEIPLPTLVRFRNPYCQNPAHRRKMRLFPTVRCYPKFEGLFVYIDLYNPKDSSHVFDLKVNYLIKGFRRDCQTKNDVLVALRLIFNHCLHNIKFARNVAPFFCSMRFYDFELHDVQVARAFFIKMRYAFLEASQIRSENRGAFRNAISFTGDCYNRLIILFSHPYHLENYLIEYMQMLLESPEDEDFKLFTVEVYRNAKNLCKKYWIKMSHLFLQLRNYQVNNNSSITFKSKIWIMLALDLYSHKYDLPKDLVMFYKEYLKEDMFSLVKMPPRSGGFQCPIPMEMFDTDPEEPFEI